MTDQHPAPRPPATDPGHLLPADEWARVVADAEAHPLHPSPRLAPLATLGASSFPSVTGFMQCKYDGGAQPGPITYGVLHDAETPLASGYARSIASYFQRNTNETSAHFMVDPVDTIQMLDTSRVAWHCGNGNTRSIGVEQAGYAANTVAQWTTGAGLTQMQRLAQLMRDIKAKHGVGTYWMSDQQLVDAHAGRIVGGWATHAQCSKVLGGSTHTDPTPNYPFPQLMALANQSAPAPAPTPTTVRPLEDPMFIATQLDVKDGPVTYAVLSGGVLTGLDPASALSAQALAKAGVPVLWVSKNDWDEFVRKSQLIAK